MPLAIMDKLEVKIRKLGALEFQKLGLVLFLGTLNIAGGNYVLALVIVTKNNHNKWTHNWAKVSCNFGLCCNA